jgi:hypothetical protein
MEQLPVELVFGNQHLENNWWSQSGWCLDGNGKGLESSDLDNDYSSSYKERTLPIYISSHVSGKPASPAFFRSHQKQLPKQRVSPKTTNANVEAHWSPNQRAFTAVTKNWRRSTFSSFRLKQQDARLFFLFSFYSNSMQEEKWTFHRYPKYWSIGNYLDRSLVVPKKWEQWFYWSYLIKPLKPRRFLDSRYKTCMIEMLDSVLDLMSPDTDLLADVLTWLGKRHQKLGIQKEHFSIIGTSTTRRFGRDHGCW